jgi:hypothetical protein
MNPYDSSASGISFIFYFRAVVDVHVRLSLRAPLYSKQLITGHALKESFLQTIGLSRRMSGVSVYSS